MQHHQAYKFALRPTGEQQRQMRRFAGSCRFVFNKALDLQKKRYERGEKKLGYAGLCKELTAWRNSAGTAWLADAPVHPLQQTLKDLERAYQNFFEGRAAFPRFRKKGMSDSFRYPDPKQIKLDQAGSRIFLPKLGWLRFRNSREVLGVVKNVTVSASGGKWFVSIQTEREMADPVHPATSMVGVDMGVANFAALSTGEIIAPADAMKRHAQRLARYQRAMSRKQKFSKNWIKAKARVQKLHARIGNKGWRGGIVVTVDPRNTSRTCSVCGHVAKENRPTQSRFECVACGHTAHADVNAACNILAAGHAVMACGGDVRPYLHLGAGRAAPMKQEPAEATLCSVH